MMACAVNGFPTGPLSAPQSQRKMSGLCSQRFVSNGSQCRASDKHSRTLLGAEQAMFNRGGNRMAVASTVAKHKYQRAEAAHHLGLDPAE